MRLLFTELVRNLGDATDRRLFNAAWNRLRSLLSAELHRRGLWDGSPSQLGVYGWRRWEDPGATLGPFAVHDDALEELTAECYSFIFVTRIWSLKAQLKVKSNIEGLVQLNLRHFLYERQKEHDPIGFRIFEMVHKAVSEAVSRGELLVVSGEPRIRNETVLAFDPFAAKVADSREVQDHVEAWTEELMPALIVAKGADREAVCESLRERVLSLRQRGVSSFRFKDLVDPLKVDARATWVHLLKAEIEPRGAAQREDRQRPEQEIESSQSFESLRRCVVAAIESSDAEPGRKALLSKLWLCLCRETAEGSERAVAPGGGLSQRKLAELSGIRRAILPGLLESLRALVAQCRDSTLTGSIPSESERTGSEAVRSHDH